MTPPEAWPSPPLACDQSIVGNGKGGHDERGFFAGGVPRISKVSRSLDSLESLEKWSESPSFSAL